MRLEHARRGIELVLAEIGERGAPARLEAGSSLLDQLLPARGQRGQHDPLVLLGAVPLDQSGGGQRVEHLGRGRGGDVGRERELPRRQLGLPSASPNSSPYCA